MRDEAKIKDAPRNFRSMLFLPVLQSMFILLSPCSTVGPVLCHPPPVQQLCRKVQKVSKSFLKYATPNSTFAILDLPRTGWRPLLLGCRPSLASKLKDMISSHRVDVLLAKLSDLLYWSRLPQLCTKPAGCDIMFSHSAGTWETRQVDACNSKPLAFGTLVLGSFP